MAMERTSGKKNEPMTIVMKSAKPKLLKEAIDHCKANDWKTVNRISAETS